MPDKLRLEAAPGGVEGRSWQTRRQFLGAISLAMTAHDAVSDWFAQLDCRLSMRDLGSHPHREAVRRSERVRRNTLAHAKIIALHHGYLCVSRRGIRQQMF